MRTRRDVPQEIKLAVKAVGEKIAKLRIKRGLSREKLAYEVGISKSYLGYIEKGETNPTVETLLLVADGLECNIKNLF